MVQIKHFNLELSISVRVYGCKKLWTDSLNIVRMFKLQPDIREFYS